MVIKEHYFKSPQQPRVIITVHPDVKRRMNRHSEFKFTDYLRDKLGEILDELDALEKKRKNST